jgi:hypothetical protein
MVRVADDDHAEPDSMLKTAEVKFVVVKRKEENIEGGLS